MDVIHVAIQVTDLERTEAFYVDALGLERSREFVTDGTRDVFVGGDGPAEIQFRYDPDRDGDVDPSGIDHLSLSVDDVDGTVERLVEETGCPVIREPTTVEETDIRLAFVEDPDGYAVELVEELD